MKFGDIVFSEFDPSHEKAKMVIARRDDCPYHTPPCLLLKAMEAEAWDFEEPLSGLCYNVDGWTKAEDA